MIHVLKIWSLLKKCACVENLWNVSGAVGFRAKWDGGQRNVLLHPFSVVGFRPQLCPCLPPVCFNTGSIGYVPPNSSPPLPLMSSQVHESGFFLGNQYARKDYVWGDPKDDGSRYVHTLRINPEVYEGKHHFHPREFRLIGFLADGLECDLNDLYSLAKTEPTALLVAGGEYSLQREQERVLDVCRELESGVVQPELDQIASLTRGEGVVLTFPKILDVSVHYGSLTLLSLVFFSA